MTTLKKQLFGVVATTVAFGAGFGFTAMALDDGVVDSTFETPAQSSGPAVPNKVAALIAKHDCWTGQAPADMEGVVPGHVVVTKHGAPHRRTAAQDWSGSRWTRCSTGPTTASPSTGSADEYRRRVRGLLGRHHRRLVRLLALDVVLSRRRQVRRLKVEAAKLAVATPSCATRTGSSGPSRSASCPHSARSTPPTSPRSTPWRTFPGGGHDDRSRQRPAGRHA